MKNLTVGRKRWIPDNLLLASGRGLLRRELVPFVGAPVLGVKLQRQKWRVVIQMPIFGPNDRVVLPGKGMTSARSQEPIERVRTFVVLVNTGDGTAIFSASDPNTTPHSASDRKTGHFFVFEAKTRTISRFYFEETFERDVRSHCTDGTSKICK